MANGIHAYTPGEAMGISLAMLGSDYIADTSAHTVGEGDYSDVRRWVAFRAITDCVFASGCAVEAGMGDPPQAAETLAAGDTWYGPLTTIVLTSGTGRAIRG